MTAGYYLTTSSAATYASLNSCPPGKTSSAGATSCTTCPAGSYCLGGNDAETCPTGYYCASGSTSPALCPMDYSCTTSAATVCSSGKYAMYGTATCSSVTLTTGYYQSSGTQYVKSVAPGYYYSSSTQPEVVCVIDNYCIYGTENSCTSLGWTTQFMSSTTGDFYCTRCAYGYACYTDTSSQVQCYNSSRYSQPGNTDCFQCERDQDCVYRNQYFEFRSNSLDQLSCPVGMYANTGDLVCSDIKQINKTCPYGYERLVNPSDVNDHPAEQRVTCPEYTYYSTNPLPSGAQNCSMGTYKETTTETCFVSPPGYIMPGNNTEDYPTGYSCTQGFYCGVALDYDSNTVSLRTSRCPYGTYARSSFTGGMSDSETCLLCPPGKYCNGTSTAVVCDTGYICELGTVNETLACPSGFYYNTAATGSTYYELCVQCPAGYVCPSMSTDQTMSACASGYICGVQSSSTGAYNSDPGYYISATGATTTSSLTVCEAGKYCPQASTVGINCPVSVAARDGWE
ncbi:MAG: hypothetical protein P4L40_25835 [Terracidiphilus sp.]|nr:hypothetical protein [Terracidiphilus sp.]